MIPVKSDRTNSPTAYLQEKKEVSAIIVITTIPICEQLKSFSKLQHKKGSISSIPVLQLIDSNHIANIRRNVTICLVMIRYVRFKSKVKFNFMLSVL